MSKGGGAVAVLPVLATPPYLDRLRVRGVGGVSGGAGDSRALCPGPTSLFMALCDGAHQPWSGWAPPIRARIQGPN